MEHTCILKYVSHTNTQKNIDKYGTDMQTVISPFVMDRDNARPIAQSPIARPLSDPYPMLPCVFQFRTSTPHACKAASRT